MIQDISYLIFRVGFAALYLVLHGIPRLAQFNTSATVIGIIALLVEFGATLLVMVGFATRIMSTAIVAFLIFFFFRYYGKLPWVQSELSLTYAMGFLGIALMGPGRFSFDAFFGWFKKR